MRLFQSSPGQATLNSGEGDWWTGLDSEDGNCFLNGPILVQTSTQRDSKLPYFQYMLSFDIFFDSLLQKELSGYLTNREDLYSERSFDEGTWRKRVLNAYVHPITHRVTLL